MEKPIDNYEKELWAAFDNYEKDPRNFILKLRDFLNNTPTTKEEQKEPTDPKQLSIFVIPNAKCTLQSIPIKAIELAQKAFRDQGIKLGPNEVAKVLAISVIMQSSDDDEFNLLKCHLQIDSKFYYVTLYTE